MILHKTSLRVDQLLIKTHTLLIGTHQLLMWIALQHQIKEDKDTSLRYTTLCICTHIHSIVALVYISLSLSQHCLDLNDYHYSIFISIIIQALRNLVKSSRQRVLTLFNQLDRRLKSADKKEAFIIGHTAEAQRRKTRKHRTNRPLQLPIPEQREVVKTQKGISIHDLV